MFKSICICVCMDVHILYNIYITCKNIYVCMYVCIYIYLCETKRERERVWEEETEG